MKKKLKRLSSFILCLVMLVTALPGATFILPVSADISSAQTDVMPDNGVEMTKTAVYVDMRIPWKKNTSVHRTKTLLILTRT